MILGRITGKTTTSNFSFKLEGETKKFDFVQAYHKDYDYVLGQITEIEHSTDRVAHCQIIGYLEEGTVKPLRIPLDTGAEVLASEEEFIQKVTQLEKEGATVGKLEGHHIPISIDLNTLLTKHISVIAKSGAGKSYTVGVLLEEILEKKIPLIIIDPHGEYSSISEPNKEEEDINNLAMHELEPKGYPTKEFGIGSNKLTLPLNFNFQELSHVLPKLSSNQQAVLYSATKQGNTNFNSLLLALETEENNAKYGVITLVEQLKATGIFGEQAINYKELLEGGKATIINLKGMPPETQALVVYKLTTDLFELRKQEKIPPFFLVVEEAHNFCPERSFGETTSSKILRTVASEGRKFGLGLCVVSQRPARVDKSVLSQCTTNIILKVTNPLDVRALMSSIEGITSYAENEISNLPIGTALITGVTDIPLLTKIRPRRSQHGGRAVEIIQKEEGEILPIIEPPTTLKDLKVITGQETEFATKLIPIQIFECKDKKQKYKIAVDMRNNTIITDLDEITGKKLPDLEELSQQHLSALQNIFQASQGNPSNLVSEGEISLSNHLLKKLTEKELVISQGNTVRLNDKILFQPLSKVSHPLEIQHKQVQGEKEETKIELKEAEKEIKKYAEILESNEAYLLNYVSE